MIALLQYKAVANRHPNLNRNSQGPIATFVVDLTKMPQALNAISTSVANQTVYIDAKSMAVCAGTHVNE